MSVTVYCVMWRMNVSVTVMWEDECVSDCVLCDVGG